MDEIYSESDVSMSPSQILERLQVLRQRQLLQRGKLQKQRLQYKETSESSSSITEIVSHFSNSTTYNTFRSLLQSSNDISNDGTPRLNSCELSQRVQEQDLIDGVSVLNLSQESEFIVNSPISSRSRVSMPSRNEEVRGDQSSQNSTKNTGDKSFNSSINKGNQNDIHKKQISLDEMPILSPKQNFEALLLEKLRNEKNEPKANSPKANNSTSQNKRPFLRRGEGMARFGLSKNDLKIQNTKSLPWKSKTFKNKSTESPLKLKQAKKSDKQKDVEILVVESPALSNTDVRCVTQTRKGQSKHNLSDKSDKSNRSEKEVVKKQGTVESGYSTEYNSHSIVNPIHNILQQKPKHPLISDKGKTWAAVLTKEQDDFLRKLKQSDYYKNFTSPTKSVMSDASCDETLSKLRQEREAAEQNMFDLLENKVSHESFNIENSFFNKFLRRGNLECSGGSTPLVLQKCLAQNPDLMHIVPEMRDRNEECHSDDDTCCRNNIDCCSDAGSSVSCCSCKTIELTNHSLCKSDNKEKKLFSKQNTAAKNSHKEVENDNNSQDDIDNDNLKANMAEMNAKLIATSELLKDRLCELEDEIETFRKENANLAKLREEIDQERKSFYEEKAAYEQKFNEEKVLSEYYLAEEKEKLLKQKQMYERYVREMRGRLNKKDKDEVVNLKKEISDLKEEIRMKDVKSTSMIARLRNQIKMIEKEKKELHDEIEKLKKQNRRIQHSNEVTRRLTNIKYLEEINKKLTNMSSKQNRPEVAEDRNAKYKADEIERQSRIKKVVPATKGTLRPRAKSVPNLNVTSRYAKYFSQRDTASQLEPNELHIEGLNTSNDEVIDHDTLSNNSEMNDTASDIEDDNHLEKMYMERFSSNSPKSNRSSGSNSNLDHIFLDKPELSENSRGFFINKSTSSRNSKSPKRSLSPYLNTNSSSMNRSKSPVSILSHKSNSHRSTNSLFSADYTSNSGSNYSQNHSKSPLSLFSTLSSHDQRSSTVIHNDNYRDKLSILSPEPSTSKTSLTKTTLNPTELRKSDGSRELRFPNGNIKYISADGKYSKFVYYNGDVKENFLSEGRIKYFYAETKTYHTTHADGLEVLEFPDGQVEKRYKDGSSEIRLPNGSVRYFDPKNEHVREEWRFPDGAALTVSASGEQRIVFSNGQIEVHTKDHKRREFPDGTVKLVYNDGTTETRYASGRVRIKDKHGNLIMDSASG